MAHPYHQHREQQVAHRRVNNVLQEAPAGAKQHATGNAFSRATSKTAAMAHDDVAGRSSPKRFARGGKVKGKGNTNIAIVLPGGGKGADPGGPPMMPPPKMPMAGPPPPGPGLPPPGGMPGMPPPGPPPGMPMRARGGKVMTAGAETGEGRLQKAAKKK